MKKVSSNDGNSSNTVRFRNSLYSKTVKGDIEVPPQYLVQ